MENVLEQLDFIRCPISQNAVYYRGDLTGCFVDGEWRLDLEQDIECDHYGESHYHYTVLYQGNDEHVLRTLIGFHLERG